MNKGIAAGQGRLPHSSPVQTYSGGRLHERPRRFVWQGVWLEVAQVLKQWRTPEELVFLVASSEGKPFLLRYAETVDRWRVERVPSAGAGPQTDAAAEKINRPES